MFVLQKNSAAGADVRRSRCRAIIAPLLVASLGGLGLAGCAYRGAEPAMVGMISSDVSERHPIIVQKQPVYLDLEVPRGSSGLTPSQRSAVEAFMARYVHEGESRITLSAPSGSRNETAAFRALPSVRAIARQSGIPGHAISTRPYNARGWRRAPLKISFRHYSAKGPECGFWPDNVAEDHDNLPYQNFGCAQQRNLAAMVANPRDLLGPQATDPRSSERRDVVWGKYIKGETTHAKRSKEEKSGNISEVAR